MRKRKQGKISLFSMKKHTDFLEFYIHPKITFTDILLVLLSVGVFIILFRLRETNSLNSHIWIVILVLFLLAISFILIVFLRHFKLQTSKVFVSSKKKEILVKNNFSKKVISFSEVLLFQISIIKQYGIYNSSGGVRGPDILVGIIEIESANLGVFKIFEFDPLIINNDESRLIEIIEKNGRNLIKEMGVPKSIQWNGIKYEHSN